MLNGHFRLLSFSLGVASGLTTSARCERIAGRSLGSSTPDLFTFTIIVLALQWFTSPNCVPKCCRMWNVNYDESSMTTTITKRKSINAQIHSIIMHFNSENVFAQCNVYHFFADTHSVHMQSQCHVERTMYTRNEWNNHDERLFYKWYKDWVLSCAAICDDTCPLPAIYACFICSVHYIVFHYYVSEWIG